jgi:phospho-N-acetylmuramoyl-pentapeptide-transferase
VLYHLCYQLIFERLGAVSAFRVFRYISFRMVAAAMTAFLVGMVAGPFLIRWLKARRITERTDKTDSPVIARLHSTKASVPTMGGIIILGSLLASTFLWARLDDVYVLLGVAVVAALGSLGAADDWIKLTHAVSHGLTRRQKLVVQTALGAAVAVGLYLATTDGPLSVHYYLSPTGELAGPRLAIPFMAGTYLPLGLVGFLLLTTLVLVGSSNAVNLTDGLDGLAISCVAMADMAFAAMAYIAGRIDFSRYLFIPYAPGVGELAVFCGAILGAGLAFLWFNCYPAEVFMGDTGSLALGGALGYVAVATRQELLLLMVGGVFVAEAVSVIIQVLHFKRTGRRVFLCTPLHHHFQFKGWPETKVTVRFGIVAAVLAALSVATLKLR